LGIVSSSPRWYVNQILADHFSSINLSIIVTYNDVHSLKPHPEPLELALSQLEGGVEDAVYIGNDIADYEAAKSARIRFLGAGWSDGITYPKSKVVELLDIIEVEVHFEG
jgi:phosphoglycolate phosphatase-like HAD superfamily hydrolase